MTDLAVGLHQFTLSLHVGVGKTNHRLKEILMGSALHAADAQNERHPNNAINIYNGEGHK